MVSPLNQRLRSIVILTSILAFSLQLSAISSYAQLSRYIRVAIIQDSASFNLRIRGFYEVIDSESQKVLYRGRNIKTTVTTYKDGISLGEKNFNIAKVLIKPFEVEAIVIDGRRFRGNIGVIKKENLHLCVVNYIDLEDYIKGVLYHEISHHWPFEALKAQAIACRTFAVYQMQEKSLKDYDVTSDIYSQVYGGRVSERYRTNKAVEDTKNFVLTYQGRAFPTYYHATCAGHTEDASMLWDIDIEPLKGVPCSFCKDSPHFQWHNVLSQEELEDKLRGAGLKIGNINDILILGRDISGRITDLNIITDKENIKIIAKDFRNIIGPNIIKSTNFNVTVAERDIVFEGLGWGHGVGLCQWGAYFMARQGHNHQKILRYYYPNSEISSLSNIK